MSYPENLSHPLILRQFKRVTLNNDDIDTASFFKLVQEAYEKYDQEQRIITHAMDLMSEEMSSLNKKLAYKAEEIKSIVESVADGIIAVNAEETIYSFNKAACEMFGYSEEELTYLDFWKLFTILESDLTTQTPSIEDTLGQFTKPKEITGKRKDGTTFPSEMKVRKTFFDNKVNFTCIIQDITEKKKAQEERERLQNDLFQAQKLEALGTLAGGVAHEINTPIQYVSDNIKFLQDSFDQLLSCISPMKEIIAEEKLQNCPSLILSKLENMLEPCDIDYLAHEIPNAAKESLEGLVSVSNIVQAIKDFSYPTMKEKILININKAIESTIIVSRNQWKYIADIETDFDEKLPSLLCNPGEINQVFLNLIINAAHAIEGKKLQDKGKIKISTSLFNEKFKVSIKDNGCGIPKEIIKKIFDLFFTTKPPGKGTGQGLSIVHNIITQKHNGSIEVNSTEGEGTEFIIYLPLSLKE